jgi:hypothetical protein
MDEVIREYLADSAEGSTQYVADDPTSGPGDDVIRLRSVRVRNHLGDVATHLDSRQPFSVEIEYVVLKPTLGLRTGFRLISSDGIVIFTARDNDGSDLAHAERSSGAFTSRCEIPGGLLKSGQYSITVSGAIPNRRVNFQVESAVSFWVESADDGFERNRAGVVAPKLSWVVERTGSADSIMTVRGQQ